MTDLTTIYLGLPLRSPLVASAGPVTGDPTMWQRLEEAGAGAIVLPSLFEEEIEQEAESRAFAEEFGTDMFGEALSYLPDLNIPDVGPARHLAFVEKAREKLTIPVIASLNGTSPGGWVRYAKHLADAGADAIELNLYDVVVDPTISSAQVEDRYVELVEEVRAEITVPLAVKLSPWFTALGNLAIRLQGAGADGLVLFNRLYQPDIDLETLTVVPVGTEHAHREPSSTPLDRQPPPGGGHLPGCHIRRTRRRGCDEAAARRRRRGDDHERAPASWPRAPARDGAVHAGLDERARVRLRRRAARIDEPQERSRSPGLRAGELLPGAAQLSAETPSVGCADATQRRASSQRRRPPQ